MNKSAIYALLGAGILLAMVAIVAVRMGAEILPLTFREVNATLHVSPFYGAMSSLGAFIWIIAGAIPLFAARVLAQNGQRSAATFLASGAAISIYTGLDDFFQIHDQLVESYLGLPQKVPLLALGLAVMLYLYFYRRFLLKSAWPYLLLALGCLAASVVFDKLWEREGELLGDWSIFVEDGLKWLGIVLWAIFHIDTAHSLLTGKNSQ